MFQELCFSLYQNKPAFGRGPFADIGNAVCDGDRLLSVLLQQKQIDQWWGLLLLFYKLCRPQIAERKFCC